MKKIGNTFTIVLLSVALGCTRQYNGCDFEDTQWKSSEGSVIQLNKDGTCKVEGLRWDLIDETNFFYDSSGVIPPIDFNGKWRIESYPGLRQQLIIERDSSKYQICSFDIGNLTTIYMYIDDPDSGIKYEFYRTE